MSDKFPRAPVSPPGRGAQEGAALPPECSECGCQHFERAASRSHFSGARETLVCRNCGRRLRGPAFQKQRDAAAQASDSGNTKRDEVSFKTAMRCQCGSLGTIASTRAEFRWWKCAACGNTWKEIGEKI